MPRVIEAFAQFLDGEGSPVVEGKLKFTVSGTNATDKDTYADLNETVANTNPVILDSEGRAPDIFGTGSYRVTLYADDDQQIDQFDPVPGGALSAQWSEWSGSSVYSYAWIVVYNGAYYRSLTNSNSGNDPETSATNWEELKIAAIYNSNRSYAVDDIVLYSDSSAYICTVAAALGETPVTDPEKWQPLSNLLYNVGEKINELGTLTGGTQDIDLKKGGVISVTISTASQTFTFSNPPISGVNGKIEMYITNAGSQTIVWPSSTQWVGGAPPVLTTSGLDLLVFTTNDAGTTWYGFVSGFDIKA